MSSKSLAVQILKQTTTIQKQLTMMVLVNTSLKDVQIHKLVTTIHLQTQMTLAVNLNLVRVV